jgi:hypothetical protein
VRGTVFFTFFTKLPVLSICRHVWPLTDEGLLNAVIGAPARREGRWMGTDGRGVRIVSKNANGEKTSQSKDDGPDLVVFERWKPLRLGGAQLLGRYLMQGVGGPNVGCLLREARVPSKDHQPTSIGDAGVARRDISGMQGRFFLSCPLTDRLFAATCRVLLWPLENCSIDAKCRLGLE